MFVVKDQDFMGMTNEFVSEAFVHFKDIPSTQLENDLGSVPQIRLVLTSPKSLGKCLSTEFIIINSEYAFYYVFINIIIFCIRFKNS